MEIKKIIKSALLISGFFFAQFCSVLIVFCYQIVTDEDLYDLCLSISDGTASASEQVTLTLLHSGLLTILTYLMYQMVILYQQKDFY